eukprot:1159043-Pelagomonas_calceolata.AAC.13
MEIVSVSQKPSGASLAPHQASCLTPFTPHALLMYGNPFGNLNNAQHILAVALDANGAAPDLQGGKNSVHSITPKIHLANGLGIPLPFPSWLV